jgi:type VII secretion-associated serine protease mycosin
MFVVSCVASLCAVAAAPAALAAPDTNCAQPGQSDAPIPWQQQMLGPERVWPFSRGGGVTVAVLAGGVDAHQPQLAGRVSAGFDATTGGGTANADCLGTGTQVAGVIAAQQKAGIGLAGLAPSVTILPVRVTAADLLTVPTVGADTLAAGINWALDHGATVIDIAMPSHTDSPALRSAVERAQTSDAVVVAAVGDGATEQDGGPPAYPTSYPGVLGVGAVDQTGALWSSSQQGKNVGLVAPGAGVITLQSGHGMATVNGTGVASGFVAAAAALVRAHDPTLSASAVVRQLTATATPAPAAPGSSMYGAGLVNPYAAVTERLAQRSAAPLPAMTRATASGHVVWTRSRQWALIGSGVALLAVLAVLILAVALPRGRRRFWRAGVAPAPPEYPEQEPGPPIQLFEDPQPN